MRRRKNKNIVSESLIYLKESKNYIFIAVLLFVLSGLIGFIFYNNFLFFDKFLKDIVDKISGLSLTGLILYIFYNNALSALIAILLGVAFGVFPVLNALLNGTLIGYVLARASQIEGVGLGVAWRLVPHGIFELPAIFIAIGLGIRLGASFFNKNSNVIFRERFKKSIVCYLVVIVPLLIVAACIEGLLIFYSG